MNAGTTARPLSTDPTRSTHLELRWRVQNTPGRETLVGEWIVVGDAAELRTAA